MCLFNSRPFSVGRCVLWIILTSPSLLLDLAGMVGPTSSFATAGITLSIEGYWALSQQQGDNSREGLETLNAIFTLLTTLNSLLELQPNYSLKLSKQDIFLRHLILLSIMFFSNEYYSPHIRWPKYWTFSFRNKHFLLTPSRTSVYLICLTSTDKNIQRFGYPEVGNNLLRTTGSGLNKQMGINCGRPWFFPLES